MSDADLVEAVQERLRAIDKACCALLDADEANPREREFPLVMKRHHALNERVGELLPLISERLDALAVRILKSEPGDWGIRFLDDIRRQPGKEELLLQRVRKRRASLAQLQLLLRNNASDAAPATPPATYMEVGDTTGPLRPGGKANSMSMSRSTSLSVALRELIDRLRYDPQILFEKAPDFGGGLNVLEINQLAQSAGFSAVFAVEVSPEVRLVKVMYHGQGRQPIAWTVWGSAAQPADYLRDGGDAGSRGPKFIDTIERLREWQRAAAQAEAGQCGNAAALPAVVREWLVSQYLADPAPSKCCLADGAGPEPVVFVRFDDFATFLSRGAIPLLPNVDDWKSAGWIDDVYVDLKAPCKPSDALPHLARLQLPHGRHRLVGIRRTVLDAPEGQREAEPAAAPPAADFPSIALLEVYSNGMSGDRIKQASRLLADDKLTANEKLTKINALIPFPATASAQQLGKMLGVKKQAVLKTDWWIQNRKGEKHSEIGRRRAKHEERANDDDAR